MTEVRVNGLLHAARAGFVCLFAGFLTLAAQAQVSIGDSGTPAYSISLAVPPGVAGMEPKLALAYAGDGANGPLGYGWGIQGQSSISRCPPTYAVDGKRGTVSFGPNDKLCLDGQRLIQTDASGNPGAVAQTGDATGPAAGAYLEFRTEKDSFSRIRAYGRAFSSDTTGASGPAYFKVWTKSGQVYEYGAGPSADANTKALITPGGSTVALAWAVSRISDTVGNHVDFKYEQRDVAWGTAKTAGSPDVGHEWNLLEVQYGGAKIVFTYADRVSVAGKPSDSAEAYNLGSKNVSLRRLQSITSYVNEAANFGALGAGGGTPVRTYKLGYDNGPVTGRSRIRTVTECAGGPSSARCLPSTQFNYSDGNNDTYTASPTFAANALATTSMIDSTGITGTIVGDFNGDGLADVLVWSDTPSLNRLYFSTGTGAFNQVPLGTGAGQFNLTGVNLGKSDQCFYSLAMDLNGDGATDIIRLLRPTNSSGAACAAASPVLLLSNRDGSFTQVAIPAGIDFSQSSATVVAKYNCLRTGPNGCSEPGDKLIGYSGSKGANFYLMDVDGDGFMDIVTTVMPDYPVQLPKPTEATLCASTTCTHVYRGSANGTFTEVVSNVAHRSLYSPPKPFFDYLRKASVVDENGDGLADVVADSGVWQSLGTATGDFTLVATPQAGFGCAFPIDYNGDGRRDCLYQLAAGQVTYQQLLTAGTAGSYTAAANFNLVTAGQELWSYTNTVPTASIVVGDFNGDGRDDILRWKDDPASNTLYLSNGDGTFTPSSTFNLTTAADQLQKSDGTAQLLLGDFTGHGSVEILRLQRNGTTNSNRLYVKSTSTPADMLVGVVSATGATTSLTYVPLTSSVAPGSSTPRYVSDATSSTNKAAYPLMDLSLPMYVVATSTQDAGVGSQVVSSNYAYRGLKADQRGRGMVGFREVLRESPSPAGNAVTTDTQFLQLQPYIGALARKDTYVSSWDQIAGKTPISSSVDIYCDSTSAAAPAAATVTAPCPTSSLVQRPYLYQSTESGRDLANVTLPTVVTTNSFSAAGDPLSISMTTSGTASGVSQQFLKVTSNTFQPDDTSCSDIYTCSWILGRLQRATVTNTVPDYLPTASAGSAPNATAVVGTANVQATTITPSLAFGSVNAGASSTLAATLTNSGTSAVSVSAPAISGADFSIAANACGTSLSPATSCNISVKFQPTASVARTGQLSVTVGSGLFTTGLAGTGAGSTATLTSAASQAFATNVVGSAPVVLAWTYRNDGNAPMTLASPTLAAPLSVTGNTCTSVAAGASCSISITDSYNTAVIGGSQIFAPSGAGFGPGVATATYTVQSVIPRWSTTSLSFGNVAVTATANLTLTLYNDGNAAYNFSGASLGLPAGFTANLGACTNVAANGGGCTVTISFTPTAAQAYSATGIHSSKYAPSYSNTLSLSGTGILAPVISSAAFAAANVTTGNAVSFSWAATNATSVSVSCTGTTSGSGSGASGSLSATTSSTGTGTCTVTATNAAGTVATASGSTNVVAAPSVTSAAFSAANVTAGTPVNFSWASTNAVSTAVSCSGTTSGTGSGATGSLAAATAGAGTGTCTVTATNAAGTAATASASTTVVAAPAISAASFSAANVTTGNPATFTWSTSNATTVSVVCGGTTAGTGSGASGSFAATTSGTGTGTCTVTAKNAAGTSTSASGSTNVVAAPSVTSASFAAANITGGDPVNFTWATSGATSATVACGGAASGSGSGASGTLAASTAGTGTGTCTVTANNAAGSTASASGSISVVAPPSVTSAAFSPSTITVGASPTFNWATANATSASVGCSGAAAGSGSGTSGSLTATTNAVGTGTCTVVATNAAGKSASSAGSVSVVAAPVVNSAIFNVSSIAPGGTAVFSWSLSNAVSGSVSCTGAGATATGSGTSGSINVLVTSAGTAFCTVVGTNAAGYSVQGFNSLSVVAPTPVPFTYVSGSGGASLYTWTFKNPNAFAVSTTADVVFGGAGGMASVSSNTCAGSIAAGATCTVKISGIASDCKLDNWSAYAYVTDSGGTVSGATFSSTNNSTICR